MEVLHGPLGHTSSTRVAGFSILVYGMIIGAIAVSQGLNASPIALEIVQTSFYSGVAILTGGKLSEAAKTWGSK